MAFLKMSSVKEFTIMGSPVTTYKKWDEATKKYLTSDKWQTGFNPAHKFEVVTPEGTGSLELSRDQLSQALYSCFVWHRNLVGSTFEVKTNGKTGLEIRYFIKCVKRDEPAKPVELVKEEEIDVNQIPF